MDVLSLVGERITIGLSAIVGITGLPSQTAVQLKWVSGGTLEIGVTSGGGWSLGYMLGTTEVESLNARGTFYLAATGATVVAHFLRTFD